MKYVKDDKREQLRLEKCLQKMAKDPHVAVGILQDEPVSKGFSLLDLATVHEFGSKNAGYTGKPKKGRIPERSFIRSTCDAKALKHSALIQQLQSKVIDGTLDIKQALTQLGEVVSKDMVQAINRGLEPELKPATIKHKKSSKPLIDTGRLKGSITHEVRGC